MCLQVTLGTVSKVSVSTIMPIMILGYFLPVHSCKCIKRKALMLLPKLSPYLHLSLKGSDKGRQLALRIWNIERKKKMKTKINWNLSNTKSFKKCWAILKHLSKTIFLWKLCSGIYWKEWKNKISKHFRKFSNSLTDKLRKKYVNSVNAN